MCSVAAPASPAIQAERSHVVQKSLGELRGVVGDGHALLHGIADDLVVDVGDIHDVLQLVSALQQEAAQHIDRDEGAEVADMAVVVNREPAGIHADEVVLRGEFLDFAGERVIELKRHVP